MTPRTNNKIPDEVVERAVKVYHGRQPWNTDREPVGYIRKMRAALLEVAPDLISELEGSRGTGAQNFSFDEGLRRTAPAGFAYAVCDDCGNIRLVDEDAKPLCMHRGNDVAWRAHDEPGGDWTPMRRVEWIGVST